LALEAIGEFIKRRGVIRMNKVREFVDQHRIEDPAWNVA